MDNNRKKSTVLCAGIFVVLVIWIILTVPCQAAETDNDEKQSQIIRVGSFEDTFDYVDKNGVRRGYGYELIRRNRTGHVDRQEICGSAWRNHRGRE